MKQPDHLTIEDQQLVERALEVLERIESGEEKSIPWNEVKKQSK